MTLPTLRQWTEADFAPFAEMSADAEVMRHFPATLTREEARAAWTRMRDGIEERGWGVWAVEADGVFAGMVGLAVPRQRLPFSPCTEVLWRLRREFWGRGLAQVAAKQAVAFAFERLGLEEVVSFTVPANVRSIRVMERAGFVRDRAGDFDHPALPEGHALRRHVLYRRRKAEAGGKISLGGQGRPAPGAAES